MQECFIIIPQRGFDCQLRGAVFLYGGAIAFPGGT